MITPLIALDLVRRIGRILLSSLFIVAAVAKLVDPTQFAQEIANFQIVNWPVAAALALFLPWLELGAAVGLWLTPFREGALFWIIGLLFLFTLALAAAAVRGLNIDCGCFGKLWSHTGTIWPMVRNVGLIALAATLWQPAPPKVHASVVGSH